MRNAGSSLSAGLTSRSVRRSLIVASWAMRDRQEVGGHGDRRAVEVAARHDLAVRRRTPSGCRWRRWPRRRRCRGRSACASRAEPCTCGGAAQRVGVLHAARSPACDALIPLSCEQRADGGGRRGLAGERALGVDARVEGPRRARAARRSSARPTMSAARASRSAPSSASASTAVDACVPLISARPSFAPSGTGARPARAQRLARPARGRPSTHAWPSPTSTSARCASGARSPLAPTEPRHGTHGWTPRLSASTSASSVSSRMPEKPRASTLARSAIIARTVRTGQRLADAGRVAAQQVQLQALERRRAGSSPRRTMPKPGVDAVDRRRRPPAIAVHDGARGRDAAARFVRERDRLRPSSAIASSCSSVSERPSR